MNLLLYIFLIIETISYSILNILTLGALDLPLFSCNEDDNFIYMKKYLSIIVFLAIITSCNFSKKRDITPITSIVEEIENIVQKQDNTVQSSIDNDKLDYIIPSSDLALDSISVRINRLKELPVKDDEILLKSTAVDYATSLSNIITSLKEYASLTDSTTTTEAKRLDLQSTRALNETDAAYNKYVKALDELK